MADSFLKNFVTEDYKGDNICRMDAAVSTPKKSNGRNNTRWGVILSYVTLAVSILGSFFVTRQVLQYVGDYNYGLYSFVGSIATWLTVITSALNSSYVHFAATEEKESGSTDKINSLYMVIFASAGGFIAVVGLTIVGILYGCQINFAHYSWEDSQIIYLLFIFTILNVSISIPKTLTNLYISYREKFIFLRSTELVMKIAGYVFHWLLAWWTRDIVWIAIYGVVEVAVFGLINAIYCRRRLKMAFKRSGFLENKTLVKQVMSFSSILLLNTIVDNLNRSTDKIILGFVSTPENVTLYQLGLSFTSYLGTITTAISSVFVPRIHKLNAEGDVAGVNALYLKVSHIQMIVTCLYVFGYVASGYNFTILWVGESYLPSYYIGIALLILNLVPVTVKLTIEIQRARNKHKFRAISFFATAILNVILTLIFVYTFPSEHVLFACVLGTAISTVLCQWVGMNWYNWKKMELPVGTYLLYLLAYVVIGLLGYGCVRLIWLIPAYQGIESYIIKFLIDGFTFVIVYGALTLIFDHKFLFSFLKKNA